MLGEEEEEDQSRLTEAGKKRESYYGKELWKRREREGGKANSSPVKERVGLHYDFILKRLWSDQFSAVSL